MTLRRVFLDANVLFSAAYRADAGLRRIWEQPEATLLTSAHAIDEARRNLDTAAQRASLDQLVARVEVVAEAPQHMQVALKLLPDKDAPILAAAMGARADVLLTGDTRHFGTLMARTDLGLRVCSPRALLL